MTTTFILGLAALAFTLGLWAYLRVRVRQLEYGLGQIREFSALAIDLVRQDIPERQKAHLAILNAGMGSGHIASYILKRMVRGQLDETVDRERVEKDRRQWSDYPHEMRLRFVQTVFTGMLADSFFAGFAGTMFRRAVFYVRGDNMADLAQSLDAYETRVMIVGSERAARREWKRENGDDECGPEAVFT